LNFERFSDKDTYDESPICQTLIVTPAELGVYLLLNYLRATAAMNCLQFNLDAIEESKGKLNTSYALKAVKKLLGHKQLTTSWAYLNYKEKSKIVLKSQENFEARLYKRFELNND
jgi:hypothetical protein